MKRHGIAFVFGCFLLGIGTACGGSEDAAEGDGGAGEGSGGDAGSSGSGGAGGSAGTDTGGSATGGTSGSATGGTSGSAGSGTGGSGGGALDPLCADLAELKEAKADELGCTGSGVESEREVWSRLCALSEPCMDELEAHYDCMVASPTWSCDTTDGHPQTDGACTSDAFFACLGPVIHERDPFGCAATAAAHDEAADTLGCDRDETLENTCNQLYLRDLCVTEWEAQVECLTAGDPADLMECDADNALQRKPDACAAENEAYEACLPG